MNICADCKHFMQDRTLIQAAQGMQNQPRCMHPEAYSRDPVMGTCYCTQERSGNKGCGKQGKLWQSRENIV